MSGVGTPRTQESLCNQKPGKVLNEPRKIFAKNQEMFLVNHGWSTEMANGTEKIKGF